MSARTGGPRRSAGVGPQPVGLATPVSGARIVLYAALVLLGLLVGIAGSLVQAGWFPGGLLLALAGSAALFHGGARLADGWLGALVPAAGWLLAVVVLTVPRPEGDFFFGAGTGSAVFLLGGVFTAVMCATLARPGVRPG